MEVRYTGIDYLVFSDTASLMASGKSSCERTIYRYSPLIAFLLVPTSIIHRSWGSFLSFSLIFTFSFSCVIIENGSWDLSVFINYKFMCSSSVIVWLFNPVTFTVGTRGNCEPIVCAMVLWIIMCLMTGNILQAAFWYGHVVHLSIYPIIYALPIILILDPLHFRHSKKPSLAEWGSKRFIFGLISGVVFFIFSGFFFYLYGWEFLHKALLFHLTRVDPRHKISIYFYHIYLHYKHEFSVLEKLISFLPQFVVQLALIFGFAPDLPFCLFVQTVAFVAFNKVITALYFVWFFCLLPSILPWSNMKLKWEGLSSIFIGVGTQIHWLMWGCLLEFKVKHVFRLLSIIHHHRLSPLLKQLGPASSNR
ncbi:hypothetical protein NMG60_11018066 [Bertholletia excelsa]